MKKKYEFTGKTRTLKSQPGVILHQIRYLRDIRPARLCLVKKGTIGGWIESEENLSHAGNCAVLDNAKVMGAATVEENAIVARKARVIGDRSNRNKEKLLITGNAAVFSHAHIWNKALIKDFAVVTDWAQVHHNAIVADNAHIRSYGHVYNNAYIHGNAQVAGHATVYQNAEISENGSIFEHAHISDTVHVYGNAQVYGNATIYGQAQVYGNAVISDKANISHDAKIYNESSIYGINRIRRYADIQCYDDFFTVGPIGSRKDYTTFYRSLNDGIMVSCGCFNDTLDAFEKEVRKTHGTNQFCKEYLAAINLAKEKLGARI